MIAVEPFRSEVPLTTSNTFLEKELKSGHLHFTSNKSTIYIVHNTIV